MIPVAQPSETLEWVFERAREIADGVLDSSPVGRDRAAGGPSESQAREAGHQVITDGAGDVIQAAVLAIKYQTSVDEPADTFHPYLTMAEALKLAAPAFTKT